MKEEKELLEEFEFKPLSEGLGFHQRSPELKKTSVNSAPPEFVIPLPRKEEVVQVPTEPVKIKPQIREAFTESPVARKSPQPALEKQTVLYRASTMDPAAVFLDLMLVAAAYLLCLIVMIGTTKIDIFANFTQPDDQGLIFASMLSLFATICFIYLMANRLFLGYTPGEWVFDQRLGTPEQFNRGGYTWKLFVRSLLVVGTGLIPIPLLSFALNKDLLGRWLDLELVKKL